jgi:tryptophan halogenase
VDIFAEASWQYLLYGMGYKTDLRPRAGVLRYYDEARAGFDEIKRQSEYACQTLPTSRELIEAVRTRSFGPAQ